MSESLHDRLRLILARVEEQVAPEGSADEATLRESLEQAPDAEIRRRVLDAAEPSSTRRAALAVLAGRLRTELTLAEVLLPLLDEADTELARDAILASPPFDPRMTERLRALLDDHRQHLWSEAAQLLARRKDPKILPYLVAWLRRGDLARSEVAFGCLEWVLDEEDHHTLLRRLWDLGEPTGDARKRLAEELSNLGDPVGSFLLEAQGPTSDSS